MKFRKFFSKLQTCVNRQNKNLDNVAEIMLCPSEQQYENKNESTTTSKESDNKASNKNQGNCNQESNGAKGPKHVDNKNSKRNRTYRNEWLILSWFPHFSFHILQRIWVEIIIITKGICNCNLRNSLNWFIHQSTRSNELSTETSTKLITLNPSSTFFQVAIQLQQK